MDTARSREERPSRRLSRLLSLDGFIEAARRHLPRPLFAYAPGGAESNASLHENRRAFAEWGFRPQVLCDVAA